MVEPDTGAVRVLVDVTPPLLSETISRLIRRPELICDIASETDGAGGPNTYAIAITDGLRLPPPSTELVITLPPPKEGAAVAQAAGGPHASPREIHVETVAELMAVMDELAGSSL